MTWAQAQGTGSSYSAWITRYERHGDDDEAQGAAGVREPRRPVQPSDSSGAALPLPRYDDAPQGVLTSR
jgi:hypothetical protein